MFETAANGPSGRTVFRGVPRCIQVVICRERLTGPTSPRTAHGGGLPFDWCARGNTVLLGTCLPPASGAP